jgi:hypothetical protein
MAEMVGLSHDCRRRTGVIGRFVAALKLGITRLAGGNRSAELRLEEWPDYLLRDIGLGRAEVDRSNPRNIDWLGR